jgi:hypothetical protein
VLFDSYFAFALYGNVIFKHEAQGSAAMRSPELSEGFGRNGLATVAVHSLLQAVSAGM